jgi:hypothetical protein
MARQKAELILLHVDLEARHFLAWLEIDIQLGHS